MIFIRINSSNMELQVAWMLVTIFALILGTRCRLLSDEETLLSNLFQGYNRAARPVLNSSHSVQIRMQFSLLHIQELNMRSQILTTTGLLILEWEDERLKWDLNEIPLRDIAIEAKFLWRPEFASINGAESMHSEYDHFRAIVHHTGLVHWEPGGIFKTGCVIDITYYPFDEQMCSLIFGAWSYHTTKMNITNTSSTVNMDSYEGNGEWYIMNTLVNRREFFFDCCPQQRFANVEFVIGLRRRYAFYIMNVILPSLMTCVLLLSIFFCTPAQKVQIGSVVLLSFRIFLLNVTDTIPRTSDNIPVLGIYLTCTLAITTMSMVVTVLILNMHYTSSRPVPMWAQHLMLDYVAPLVCMKSYSIKYTRETNEVRFNQHLDNEETDSHVDVVQGESISRRNSNISMKAIAQYNDSDASGDNSDDFVDREEIYSRDWRMCAEVVDRCFFWLFCLATLVSTLILFHPLTMRTRAAAPSSTISENK